MKDKRELSRAEVARQRRAKRAADELTQTGKRAITPMVKPVIRQATKPVPKMTFAQAEEKKKRRFNICAWTFRHSPAKAESRTGFWQPR